MDYSNYTIEVTELGMVRWYNGLVKLSVPGVLLIWIIVGQKTTASAVGAGGVCSDILLLSIFSLFYLPLSGRRPNIDRNTVSKCC